MATNPNVGFLMGTQQKLNTLTSFQAGAFYLTTDSNRLYFAQSDSKLEYLNKYITTVAKATDLYTTTPTQGDFYYVTEGNILCFYNGGNVAAASGWTQVNAQAIDTDTDTKVTGVTITKTAADADSLDYKATVTSQLYDVKSGSASGEAVTKEATFSINKSDLDAWYNKANIDLSSTAPSGNKTVVSLSGTGAASGASVNITGGTNITLSGTADNLTISATDTDTTYDLASDGSASAANIKLTSLDDAGSSATDTIALSGNTDVIVNGSTANTITITHKTGYLGSTSDKVSAQDPQQGSDFTIISGVRTSNGHVTAINTATVTLPEISDADVNADGKLTITVRDGAGNTETVTGTNAVGYDIDGTLVPLGADLADYFYTETEIDNKFAEHLKSVNAMIFKGSVTELPSSASIGDTYIVGDGTFTVPGEGVATAGDIIVAYSTTGAESANGTIASADLKWTLIPGNETDTTYTLSAASNKITLTPSSGNAQNVTLADDDVVTLTSAGNTITANHAKNNPTSTKNSTASTLAHGGEVMVVTDVTANDYGHVTSIKAQKYKLPAAHSLAHGATSGNAQLKDGAGNVVGEIDVVDGTRINVTASDNTHGANFTVNHATGKATETRNTTASTLAYDGEFTVVTDVTQSSDNTGHLATIKTQKYKMPALKTYALSGATVSAANNIATITDTLKDGDGTAAGTSVFSLGSSSLEVAATGTQVNVNLVWGSF